MDFDANFASLMPFKSRDYKVALAPFVPLTDAFYVSGQVASLNGALIASGLVGAEVDLAKAQECAYQCAVNVISVLQQQLGSLNKIKKILRLGIYVASADGFTSQHLAGHGASQVFLDVFGEEVGTHSRTAIGVKSLPLNSPVEVDAIVSAEI